MGLCFLNQSGYEPVFEGKRQLKELAKLVKRAAIEDLAIGVFYDSSNLQQELPARCVHLLYLQLLRRLLSFGRFGLVVAITIRIRGFLEVLPNVLLYSF